MGLLSGSVFSIGPLNLIGMWFMEDQRAQHHKDTCVEEIKLRLQILINNFTLRVNTIGRTYDVSN
jgi:hypothetical protein